jgi:hypothetical protein
MNAHGRHRALCSILEPQRRCHIAYADGALPSVPERPVLVHAESSRCIATYSTAYEY